MSVDFSNISIVLFVNLDSDSLFNLRNFLFQYQMVIIKKSYQLTLKFTTLATLFSLQACNSKANQCPLDTRIIARLVGPDIDRTRK